MEIGLDYLMQGKKFLMPLEKKFNTPQYFQRYIASPKIPDYSSCLLCSDIHFYVNYWTNGSRCVFHGLQEYLLFCAED